MSRLAHQPSAGNSFDDLGRFILADYDHKRPFASFLPGIAGLRGIPMWVFYVNRGQGVCSFGVEDKDHPMLEFQAANRAYQTTAQMGFRTFLNGTRQGTAWQREAFSPWDAAGAQRTMFIGMNEVAIREVNPELGYQVDVLYFMLPNMPFSGLVRQVSLKNLLDSPLELEILDGLPVIVPYGVDNRALKDISRTVEAWMQVANLENNLPYYRLKTTPGDTAAVKAIEAGNFALAFSAEGLVPAFADPQVIFGWDTSQSRAHRFHQQGLAAVLESTQITEGRSPCAFFGTGARLNPSGQATLTSVYGYSPNLASIQSHVAELTAPLFIERKLGEARQLTEELTEAIRTESASGTFDGYCRQTFLDNVLRGGYPMVLGEEHIVHVFGRKHGDIERDYNYFVFPPEYYSQGNGNYRDVNQNRRNDVFFVPQAGEFNLRVFMSLIQADGYNPLVLNGLTFSLPAENQAGVLAQAGHDGRLAALLGGRFSPGELLEALMDASTTLPPDTLFEEVFSQAEAHLQAEHGAGYWVDHWTYNLDLIESYLAVFPDRKAHVLFESQPLPFYDSATIVQPHAKRFVLYQGRPHQLNALVEDPEKARLIGARTWEPHWARAQGGQGEVFRLPLISKLVLLAVIKFATLDPSGMGIQMEAGRPGWYDALNGLPGLFGSSMPETCELLRLVTFLADLLDAHPRSIALPVEAEALLDAIAAAPEDPSEDFSFWRRRTDALEAYRASTRLGFDGRTLSLDIQPTLEVMRAGLEVGLGRAHTFGNDLLPTYFIYEVTKYDLAGSADADGNPYIQVHGFSPAALPLFLEGPTRQMKISDRDAAGAIARVLKHSALLDEKLGMYKVNAALDGQPFAIGRARAFTPGWLENESVWLHMAFKYLLQLLEAGLYDDYFEALQAHLPAFMDPEVYGRSPLENSSFIVSSAHPDAALHGAGFVARLSGSTAEFLSMWCLMTAGKQPFRLEEGVLVLAFKPVLPGWLFREDGTFTFRFLGTCTVTVHHPERTDTWRAGVAIQRIELHSEAETVRINGAMIGPPYAERVRSGEFTSIDLFY